MLMRRKKDINYRLPLPFRSSSSELARAHGSSKKACVRWYMKEFNVYIAYTLHKFVIFSKRRFYPFIVKINSLVTWFEHESKVHLFDLFLTAIVDYVYETYSCNSNCKCQYLVL